LKTAYSLVVEQAGAIQDNGLRDRFLATYGEILSAREEHRATSPR